MTYSTVRAANGTELSYIRGKGQWSKLYLAVFKPSAVYSATLASLPSSSDSVTSISFTGGTGTLADVLQDMTLFVGSTPGGYDYGVARIRKAPIAGTFYIGEESDIYWEIGCYLTVVNEFDLWAKHIRTVSDTEFYMDYDVAYTDQNTNFSPVPIMGSHRVLKLSGVSVSTAYDWSNSYCIGSSITGYSVVCSTATITGGTTSTPTLQFSAAGWHTVVLTVTAANGKTSVGVRYVYVYSTSAMPARVFQLESCNGDYETGGWNFSVSMQDEIELSIVPERTMCILFAEDYYGDTQVSCGQVTGSENIICIGKIAEESTSLDAEMSEVTLTIYGMQYWMEKVYAFPTGALLKTTSPTNWAEMQSPTVDKILFRLFHWGSTATKIMDIYLTNDTRIASELISPASNLWAQVQEIAFTTIYARPGVDRFGRMFIEVEPQVVPVASRTWPSVMTIGKTDWHDSVRIQRIVVTPQSMVNSSGVYVLTDGSGGAYFSLSPGHVFKHYGSPDVIDRLLLSTQAASNQFAGLVLNWKNNQFPNSEMLFPSNNRMIDCFPRQKVTWSVDAIDTPRGFSFNKGFIPRRVEFHWEADTGFLSTAVSLEMETNEGIYVNGDIPGQGADPSQPPTPPAYPPLPDFPVIIPGDVPTSGTAVVIFHDANQGFWYSTNFNQTSPTWQAFNSGLTSQQYQSANRFIRTPSGACYCAYVGNTHTNSNPGTFVARAPSVGGTWTVLLSNANLSSGGNRWGIHGIGINGTLPDTIGAIVQNGQDASTLKGYLLSAGSFTVNGVVTGSGYFYPFDLSYGYGKWVATSYWNQGDGGVRTASAGMSSWTSISHPSDFAGVFHVRAGTTGKTFHQIDSGNSYYIGTNNCASYTLVGPLAYVPLVHFDTKHCFDSDPTGAYCMTRWDGKGRSSDGGYTWGPIPNLPVGSWFFSYAGVFSGSHGFVAAGGSSIRLTQNFGEDWINKEGNLTSVIPIPSINFVKAVP